MVKIVIDNIYSKIVGHLPEEVQSDLKKTLAFRVPTARFMPKYKKRGKGGARQWDGYIRLYYKNKGQSFYTGLMAFVREVLQKHNIEYSKVDNRHCPPQNLPDLIFTPPPNFEDRDYQKFTIDRSLQFTRGVLGVATGGGKTMIVTRMISEIKTYPFIFYVLTKDLMEQAHDTLSTCLNEPIGKIGDGVADIRKINVCTIQTAVRALNDKNSKFNVNDYKFDDEDSWDEKSINSEEKRDAIRHLIGTAKGIYFDETHHAAARICKDVLTASMNAYWRFGGSATPYRETGDEIMIQAMFGSKVVDISASYLIKKGFLVTPNIFFEPIDSEVDFHSYAKVYENAISKNDAFNNHVANTANHLVSRGKSNLVLVQQYPQGDYLKGIIPNSVFVTSRMTSKQRKQSLQDLKDRKIMCMIATSLADEGLDVPTLDSALLAGGGKSSTRLNQRIGRTIRKDPEGKKDKSIVVVYDHYKTRFLKDHTKKVKGLLKKEKEFKILNSKGPDFINSEIDQALGCPSDSQTLFDI